MHRFEGVDGEVTLRFAEEIMEIFYCFRLDRLAPQRLQSAANRPPRTTMTASSGGSSSRTTRLTNRRRRPPSERLGDSLVGALDHVGVDPHGHGRVGVTEAASQMRMSWPRLIAAVAVQCRRSWSRHFGSMPAALRVRVHHQRSDQGSAGAR